jgi:general stress protein 26
MPNIEKLKSHPEAQLWDHLEDVRFVMLGSPDAKQHMQPMAPQVDKKTGTVWFYTNKKSELVAALKEVPSHVHMCVTEKDYQACVYGSLVQYHNRDKIDQYWSPVIGAWFNQGKDDPELTMLCFTPHNASVWVSDVNPITFAYEIGKANLTGDKPDIGERASVDFA